MMQVCSAACFIAAENKFSEEVCLSIRPSVTPFSQCSSHHIMKFLDVITFENSDVHAKVQGQRSKVKVTQVKANFAEI